MKGAVVFDLDGTLVDSLPDIAGALNVWLAAQGAREVPVAAIRAMMGDTARELVARALRHAGARVPEARELDAAAESFLSIYRAAPAGRDTAYRGASTVLGAIRAAGLGIAVCTNKERASATKVLTAAGLMGFVDALVGVDEASAPKPDPSPLRLALARLGADAATAIVVGDSGNDIAMAHALGLKAVGCRYGYPRVAAELDIADRCVAALTEVPAALAALGLPIRAG